MGKIRKYFRDLSFRTSFTLYVVITAVAVFFLIMITANILQYKMIDIHSRYPTGQEVYYTVSPTGEMVENSFSSWVDEAAMAELVCKGSGKAFDYQCSVTGSPVIVDRDMIMEVIENLIVNGVRYAQEKVSMRITKENNMLVISVMDDGGGFTPESLKHAVEPYYTADENRSAHFGLGLYICKILSRHHGGDIRLNNTGSGAMVTVWFAGR